MTDLAAQSLHNSDIVDRHHRTFMDVSPVKMHQVEYNVNHPP
jgi:hypothetical protein